MDYTNHIFRSHMVGKLINVPKPLTKNQNETLLGYSKREAGLGKPLTQKQKELLVELQYKEIKSREYKLSNANKRYLREYVAFAERGVRLFNGSKQTQKGIFLEKKGRDILADLTGLFLTKSVKRKQNQWVSGLTDFKCEDLSIVPDIKMAWSLTSFNNIIEDSANEDYLRQLDCYMELEEKDESLLIHILEDTPIDLLEGEIRKLLNNPNYSTLEGELTDEGFEVLQSLMYNHVFTKEGVKEALGYAIRIYGDVYFEFTEKFFDNFNPKPIEERIHMIPHKFDEQRINQRNTCILLARDYMNKVKPINNFNTKLIA